jgi:hypothetical protein
MLIGISPKRETRGCLSALIFMRRRGLTGSCARAQHKRLTLSHPDFTVGPGISPSPEEPDLQLLSHCKPQ